MIAYIDRRTTGRRKRGNQLANISIVAPPTRLAERLDGGAMDNELPFPALSDSQEQALQ